MMPPLSPVRGLTLKVYARPHCGLPSGLYHPGIEPGYSFKRAACYPNIMVQAKQD